MQDSNLQSQISSLMRFQLREFNGPAHVAAPALTG